MPALVVKDAAACRWDCVALGEVMLRLDPGEGRVRTARSFRVWEGGGEYNVARGLRRCFGMRTALVSAFADNDVGRLLEDLILQGGVDMSRVRWVKDDGVGRRVRNGLNFTERGFGLRPGRGTSDRGHTAASQLKKGDIDWDGLFAKEGVRWFHTGGIFAALSPTTPEVILEAVQAARANGTVVSFDLNYRDSLWRDVGGKARAMEVNRELAPFVDVMIGNEEDFHAALGFEIAGTGDDYSALDPAAFKRTIAEVVRTYPNLRAVATTLRVAHTASRNDWGAILWHDGAYHEATKRPNLDIMDRIGGGDSFASGLAYGFLAGKGPALAVEYGAAHGALAMTTPGDTSMATLAEVEAAMKGGTARVIR